MNMERDFTSPKRTADSEAGRFDQALDAFKTAESTAPGWDETKRLILTGNPREHDMIQNDRATTAFWNRKPALVSLFSFIFLIAFFAVPFSQTSEIGARLTFELSEPSGELQAVDFASILDDPAYGIDSWNTSMMMNNEGAPLILDLLLLTEDPGAPGAVLAALTADYPVLAAAETTINPVTENSSGSIFNRLTGGLDVQITCEGMVAAEIEEKIRQSLIENGAEGVDVEVTESNDGEQRQITIKVTDDEETGQ